MSESRYSQTYPDIEVANWRASTVLEPASRQNESRRSARCGAVLGDALVDERDDLVEGVEGLILLGGDAADEGVDALDVGGAAEQGARGGRWLAEALGGLGVLVERDEIGLVGAEAVAQPGDSVEGAVRLVEVAVDGFLDRDHAVGEHAAVCRVNVAMDCAESKSDGVVPDGTLTSPRSSGALFLIQCSPAPRITYSSLRGW
ncbi:MAG TPA: hypothetical protein VGD80_35350 [Kofleriaceae bacterium]